jgi:flagellar motor switch protein FliM
LSQEEIDTVFRNLRDSGSRLDDFSRRAQSYDFRRPDSIAKDQLRAIHLLHENFARSLASSLSAYLRAYVIVNLVSVEQLSFMEFSQCLPSPTCLVSLGMKPYDGNAVLELNPVLVFPVLEMLLGGSSKVTSKINREITDIEQSILEGLIRIILHDLKETWRPVAAMDFSVEAQETEPQLLRILAPNETMVAISMEVRIADAAGMMNLGIPSIIIKMLRQKFDQQWSFRKAEPTEQEHARVLHLVKSSQIHCDVRLQGPTLTAQNLLNLRPGDILEFDYPVDRPVDMLLNGRRKYRVKLASAGRKRGVIVQEPGVLNG